MAAPMTVADLHRILVACAGEGDGPALDESTVDVAFDDLGYDSLARMETTARIEQEFGVKLPGDEVTEAQTPAELLDLVNGALLAAR